MASRTRESHASLQAQVDKLTRELAEARAGQAVVASENARLIGELQARDRELAEALEQQTATAGVLKSISRSAFDLQAILDTLTENATRLTNAEWGTIFRPEGERLLLAASYGAPKAFIKLMAEKPSPFDRSSLNGRIAVERRPIRIADVLVDPEYRRQDAQEVGGYRSAMGVPLLRGDQLFGTLGVIKNRVEPFTDRQIELIQSFADQAVIAIENARLIGELKQRLDEQTATAEVLRVISESPTELQKVLDVIAEAAWRLSAASLTEIYHADTTGVNLLARFGEHPGVPLGSGSSGGDYSQSITGVAFRERRTIHVPDILALPEGELTFSRRLFQRYGTRAGLSLPLMRGDAAVGVISVRRAEPGPFSDRQITLLETFADQAAIAISNAELFQQLQERNASLREALEQQTATAEVLEVISRSPTNLQSVLDTICKNAGRLCGGVNSHMWRVDGDETLLVANWRRVTGETNDLLGLRIRLTRENGVSQQAILENRTVYVPDLEAVPIEQMEAGGARLIGVRSLAATPLYRDGVAIGTLTVHTVEPNALTPRHLALLETFAAQAVIAMENTRLFTELQQRLEEQTATADILRVIAGAPTDLPRVLDGIVHTAMRVCAADDATLVRIEEDEGVFGAHVGKVGAAPVGTRFSMNSLLPGVVQARALIDGQVIHVGDLLGPEGDDYPASRANAQQEGTRAILAVPLLRGGRPIGDIVVRRSEPRPFSDRQIMLLETFADQAVIAISNAELFQQLQSRTRELAESVEQLTAVFEVGQAVSSTLALGALLDTIAARAVEISGADGGGIFELEEENRRLHLRTAYRQSTELVDVLRRAPLHVGEGAAGRAVATREPVQVADATDEGAYQSSVREILIRGGFRALLAVPLLRENQVLGALVLNRRTPGEFAPAIVELVKTFASQSAIALQNARLFQELAEKNRALELAGRHKSQFLANMSHELRTPLNAILGYTELILDGIYGGVPDEIRDVLGRVETSGRHLLGLINAVLDLSKIEAGQLTLTPTDYSLADVIQTALASVEALAAEKGLALRLDLALDLPIGHGDERRISQVLLNLVGNAIKFTEVGEIRVSASAADGQFIVAVADSGPGIAKADQERIFEEFQQIDASSTREKGGTGLGLSIARRIVELHGGRIWVESAVGKGATFKFVMPVRVDGA
jgi:GAF domain-containing protein/anti-sigma regulatory factor (Ser/Thr protein kinase)